MSLSKWRFCDSHRQNFQVRNPKSFLYQCLRLKRRALCTACTFLIIAWVPSSDSQLPDPENAYDFFLFRKFIGYGNEFHSKSLVHQMLPNIGLNTFTLWIGSLLYFLRRFKIVVPNKCFQLITLIADVTWWCYQE